jgi:hypothetical protein
MNAHADIHARLQSVLGPQRSAEVVALAQALDGGDDAVVEAFEPLANLPTPAQPVERRPSGPRRRVIVPVSADDARQAGGADLVHRTIAAVEHPDSPDMQGKARAVIAALRDIAPKTAIEGGLAGLFVAMERAAFDCLRIARIAGFDSPMGAVMLSRAEKLTCRATEVADAISRQRSKGKTQHIVVQRIHGGQAVGMVNQREPQP